MNFVIAIASIVLFPVVAMAADGPFRCSGTGIQVSGWNTDERDRVCSAAAAAIAFFKAAGVAYHADDLTIRPLLPGGDAKDQSAIGRYDAFRNEIFILPYGAAIVESKKHLPAFKLPMSVALWQSVISHETAHAVAEQNFALGVHRPTASEYIAVVVQLATLPPDLQKTILERNDANGFADASEISMLLYEIDPAVFAVMAYRHYAALGDRGADFIARLLREGLDQ